MPGPVLKAPPTVVAAPSRDRQVQSQPIRDARTCPDGSSNSPLRANKRQLNGSPVSTTGARSWLPEFVILLSFFDGIASAAKALQDLNVGLLLFMAWETCKECQAVATAHFPDVWHRDDFRADNPQAVAGLVYKAMQDSNIRPTKRRRHDQGTSSRYPVPVLLTGGPPCWDFSIIKGDAAKGRHGEEGKKFDEMCDWIEQFELHLEHACEILIENVVAKTDEDALHFDKRLSHQQQGVVAWHFLCDAADEGIVGRPRMWWTRSKLEDANLRWSKQGEYHKLFYSEFQQKASDIQTDGLQFPTAVLNKQGRMPCFTTPAPSEQGRPAPKHSRQTISEDGKNRWQKDSRTYAPWHYERRNMMTDSKGDLHLPTAEIKEQMHHLPAGYTAVANTPMRARHRMLGNGWHVGVAKFILYLVLCAYTGACADGAVQDKLSLIHI